MKILVIEYTELKIVTKNYFYKDLEKSNEQQAQSNEQRAKSNEQRATSKKSENLHVDGVLL